MVDRRCRREQPQRVGDRRRGSAGGDATHRRRASRVRIARHAHSSSASHSASHSSRCDSRNERAPPAAASVAPGGSCRSDSAAHVAAGAAPGASVRASPGISLGGVATALARRRRSSGSSGAADAARRARRRRTPIVARSMPASSRRRRIGYTVPLLRPEASMMSKPWRKPRLTARRTMAVG